MRIRAVPAALGLVTILGAVCSSDDPSAVGTGAPSEESIADAAHNEADVAFAQSMIPHHEQAVEMMIAHHKAAVEMADQEIADGESPEALALAEEIKSAQEGEIAEMESLLEEL